MERQLLQILEYSSKASAMHGDECESCRLKRLLSWACEEELKEANPTMAGAQRRFEQKRKQEKSQVSQSYWLGMVWEKVLLVVAVGFDKQEVILQVQKERPGKEQFLFNILSSDPKQIEQLEWWLAEQGLVTSEINQVLSSFRDEVSSLYQEVRKR